MRCSRLLFAKTPLNKLNRFDWKPYKLEVYGSVKPPTSGDKFGSSSSVASVNHNFIPEREEGEVSAKPLPEFPVSAGIGQSGDRSRKGEFIVVGPKQREAKVVDGVAVGSGGRKTAQANALVSLAARGMGEITINSRSISQYFPVYMARELVLEPLLVTETLCDMNVRVQVNGGGKSAQAGAIRLAIARALQNFDPNYRWALKLAGCLVRDARQVERKKTGKPKARRSKQWSKR